MRPNRDQLHEAIIALAHGEDHPLRDAVMADAALSADLAQWTRFVADAQKRTYQASEDAIARAKALMPSRRVAPFWLRPALAGTRSVAAPLVAELELDGTQVQLMYVSSENGIEVLAEASAPVSAFADNDVDQSSPNRFRFTAADLASAECTIVTEKEERWVIPAPLQS